MIMLFDSLSEFLTNASNMVSGDVKFASGLQAYLLSRDYSDLKSEFQEGNGKVNALIGYLVKLLMKFVVCA